jgi:hypothetical protein
VRRPRPPGTLAVALLAAVVAGCGGGDGRPVPHDPPPHGAAHARPSICARLHERRTGVVQAPQTTELSGLVLSRRRPGVLWTHNDSGDRPRVLALHADGTLLGDVAVTGAEAIDWEDIAVRGGQLFLADIGDNDRKRDGVVVYRVPEPAPDATATAPSTALRLRYPDGPHDAETLLVDPRTGAMAIVAKQLDGGSGVYVAARPSPSAVTTLRRVATLHLGLGALATGGDVSADGRVIAVRTYGGLVAWQRRRGDSLAHALRRRPCAGRVSLAREGQGEALALTAGGGAFYTVPESERPAIRRYAGSATMRRRSTSSSSSRSAPAP